MNGKKQNKLPRRWGEERVRTVLAHYDRQTEDEVASEIDAAFEKPGHAILAIPVELVAKVRTLVAKKRSTKQAQRASIPRTKRAATK
jgi:hypothetical protein